MLRLLIRCCLLASAGLLPSLSAQPADPAASRRTRHLFANLQALAGEGTFFGHQDALAYGLGWAGEPGRSDVKSVCGAHPAVVGWDLSKLGKYAYNIDSVPFGEMRRWMEEVYRMGGVNTISWHLDNPVTGGSTWDTTRAVAAILPGGPRHAFFVAQLDTLAAFLGSIRAGFPRRPVPLIFRPWHEHTGNWFWWGAKLCSPEEYKALWRFTVRYLREEKQLHHLLFAYSPDLFEHEAQYLERYPGDEYVDLLGLDDYGDVGVNGDPTQLSRRLRMVAGMAEARGKLSALTETGQERIPQADWWTRVLIRHIDEDSIARGICYALVWRNDRKEHFYGPAPGHPSAEDFRAYYRHPASWFAGDVRGLYRRRPVLPAAEDAPRR